MKSKDKHYFGWKENGQLFRFFKGFSDEEFIQLFIDLGGRLPAGIVSWHFKAHETIHNSSRVQEIAKLPLIKNRGEAAQFIKNLLAKQQQEWQENIGGEL